MNQTARKFALYTRLGRIAGKPVRVRYHPKRHIGVIGAGGLENVRHCPRATTVISFVGYGFVPEEGRMKLVISEDNVNLEELKQLLERMTRRMDLIERQLDFVVERLGPVEPEIEAEIEELRVKVQ